jgi:GT2 family glycosyltransferase
VLDPLSTTAPQTRHTVTALIVAHDGAQLLPSLVQALKAQTYQVEQTVGVDTGSRDRSGAVLAELIGQDAVFGMNRSTGYGEAVAVALRHATRRRSGMTDPGVTRVEWIWLLHDDCEPAPDALEKLLRAASRDRSVVVLGPKVLDGQDRRTLREAGVSIDRAGRRVTGIDPGEIDQGQHDHKRAVLAVGSAGMLVRRDVWERLGGFDPALRFFRDDVDFCWRVQAAGLRVQVVTDAILYHRELGGRRRRPTEGNSRRLDRRNALYVLAVNLPLLTMLRVVGGSVVGSLIRATYFLLTKQLDLSAAYAYSVLSLFAHPIRLFQGRRRRAAGIAEGYYAVRVFIPPARTLFRLAEKIAGLVSNGPPQATYGRHQATVEESEEDEQFVDQQSVVRRIIGHPGVQLFVALLVIALVAERRLLAATPLGGGALVPAWGGAGALWQEYLAGFHAVSVGSTASAPPYLAVVAGLATVLGGQAWLAVDVLLLGCVPLAGLTAYLATRRLVTSTPARMLLAASYALLPVATGAVAAGRLGTAVAFILLPLVALSAGRMLTAPPRHARRAAWATGLLIALAAAFAPLTWVLGLVFALGALGARRWLIAVNPVNAVIVVATPFFVLFPWSLHLLTSPSAFLSEAGLSAPTTRGLSPAALLALSPGGPGVPPVWVTIGLALALLALVLPVSRTGLVIGGWAVAVAGILTSVLVSRVSVTPATGGQPSDGWPGVAMALAALGLLLASAPAAQWLVGIIPNGSGRLAVGITSPAAGYGRSRRALAFVALAAAATAPLLVAGYWVKDGVRGPIGTIGAPLVPAFVSASSTSGEQYRTLILRPNGAGLDYQVVRQGDPTLGEPELGTASAAGAALSRQVAALGAPDEADAGDPGLVLGSFGIRWVMLPGPVDPVLAQRLDASLGLVALNKGASYDLWQVTGPVARVRVVAPDGTTTELSSGTVDMSGVAAPASGGTLVLAEPYGGWTAKLNGQALEPVATPVDGWAQGFVLPSGGGQLSITRNNLARELSLALELLATLAICLLALPGKRTDPVQEAKALSALREARNGKRAASSARRAMPSLRAAGAGHRAAGAADRPGSRFAGGRRAGEAQTDQEPANDEVLADQAATTQVRVGRARRAKVPAAKASAAQAPSAEVAMDAELTEPARPEAVTTAGLADSGQGRHGRHGRLAEADRGDAPGAPWDMAGDWDRPAGTAASDAWAADPLDTSKPLRGGGRRDDPARLSGQHGPSQRHMQERPASDRPMSDRPLPEWPARERPARERSVPESPVLGTPVPPTGPVPPTRPGPPARPVPQTRPAPPDSGPQRPPWESGPQVPLPAKGTQPRYPWESGPQAPVAPAASPPASRTGAQPGPRTGKPSASWTADQPASRTGDQPTFGTGPQPVPPTGAQPVERAPWESGDWGEAPDWDAVQGGRDQGTAAPEPDPGPGMGSGPWPTAGRPAKQEKQEKQERHSHRAAKHGRPSRWRGSGNRSTGDGES